MRKPFVDGALNCSVKNYIKVCLIRFHFNSTNSNDISYRKIHHNTQIVLIKTYLNLKENQLKMESVYHNLTSYSYTQRVAFFYSILNNQHFNRLFFEEKIDYCTSTIFTLFTCSNTKLGYVDFF